MELAVTIAPVAIILPTVAVSATIQAPAHANEESFLCATEVVNTESFAATAVKSVLNTLGVPQDANGD